jgi:hypothetical protein
MSRFKLIALMGTVIKLSVVGAGHARDEEAKIKHCSLNIVGMARSYGLIVLNLMAVRRNGATNLNRDDLTDNNP